MLNLTRCADRHVTHVGVKWVQIILSGVQIEFLKELFYPVHVPVWNVIVVKNLLYN